MQNTQEDSVQQKQEDHRQKGYDRRRFHMAAGIIIGLVLAMFIFIVGVVVGKAGSYFSGRKMMNSGYGHMHGQMGGYPYPVTVVHTSGSTGVATPPVPTNTPSNPTTVSPTAK